MRIYFTSNGKEDCEDLEVHLHPRGVHEYLILRWGCGGVTQRHAVVRMLQNDFEKTIEGMVRRAYEQGLKDGRAKRARKTIFSSTLRDDDGQVCW